MARRRARHRWRIVSAHVSWTTLSGKRSCANSSKFSSRRRGRRERPLDHVLVFGSRRGLGKTTLSYIVANEMGGQLRQSAGPVLERGGDLAAILTSLQEGDVLFIDEIHRLQPAVEEILYPALEDCRIDLMIGEGAAARSIQLDLPPFTLVGARPPEPGC